MSTHHGISVTIEFGDGYQPTERISAAIGELAAAIQDAYGEVQGFADLGGPAFGNLVARWSPTTPLEFSWGTSPAPTPSPLPRSITGRG